MMRSLIERGLRAQLKSATYRPASCWSTSTSIPAPPEAKLDGERRPSWIPLGPDPARRS